MPANPFNNFTDYGIGISLRVPHYDHIFSRKPTVGWFEIISENFMCDGGRPLKILDKILDQYCVVQHGVSMYFGSSEKLDREHLEKMKRLVKRTKTPWPAALKIPGDLGVTIRKWFLNWAALGWFCGLKQPE